jgi:hypothetical protein
VQVVSSSLDFARARWISLVFWITVAVVNWKRVAERVRDELDRRNLSTPNAVYAESRIDPKTLARLLEGREVRRDAQERFAMLLGWTPDSLRLIASGGEPRLLDEALANGDLEVADLRHPSGTEAALIDDLIDWLSENGHPPTKMTSSSAGFDAFLEMPHAHLAVEAKVLPRRADEGEALQQVLGALVEWNYRSGGHGRPTIPVLLMSREPSTPSWTGVAKSVGVVATWPPHFPGLADVLDEVSYALAAMNADAEEQRIEREVHRPAVDPQPDDR